MQISPLVEEQIFMQGSINRSRQQFLFACPTRQTLDSCDRQTQMRRDKHEFQSDAVATTEPGFKVSEAARGLFYALCGARGPSDMQKIHILSQGSIETEVLFWKDLMRWPGSVVYQCVEGLFGETSDTLAAFVGFETMGGFQEYVEFETFVSTLNSNLSLAGMSQETISLLLNDAAAHFKENLHVFESAESNCEYESSQPASSLQVGLLD